MDDIELKGSNFSDAKGKPRALNQKFVRLTIVGSIVHSVFYWNRGFGKENSIVEKFDGYWVVEIEKLRKASKQLSDMTDWKGLSQTYSGYEG